MLNAERTAAAPAPYWDGNLRHLTMRAWVEDDSQVAAIVVAEDGQARGWFNLRHVHPDAWCLVWLHLRRHAQRGPFTILYADDLVGLATDGGQQESPA